MKRRLYILSAFFITVFSSNSASAQSSVHIDYCNALRGSLKYAVAAYLMGDSAVKIENEITRIILDKWKNTGVSAEVAGMLIRRIDAVIEGINDSTRSGQKLPTDVSSIDAVATSISEDNYNMCFKNKW